MILFHIILYAIAMHELSGSELSQAIRYAKAIDDDDTIQEIIDRFQREQTALADTVFGIFPDVVEERDQDMAFLFTDLCFNVICIFHKVFGPLPSQTRMDPDWLENQIMLLNSELLSIDKHSSMNGKIKKKLQDRFVSRAIEDTPQLALLDYLDTEVDDFSSENPCRLEAGHVAKVMLFIVVRLLCNLYGRSAA